MKKYIFIITTLFIFINLGAFLDLTDKTMKSDLIVVLGGGKDARKI